ncbi:MerR family transcriptional regulator [Loigolactobacillus backii]|uniref:MerR family transcriptional regulator n=1 Tax=Loigolactobacillus backii TaxID=375175 RepID=A0A192GZ79_9LACO|nr:MerR family transcriptional regulator [Loigolactobacillus backii]ANK58933.1 MerR family transcriptional regulator [Loigolactobacillus backii]ANK61395.1 MerR family transcriptional regulator [Loigolactobacillus backii]ANK63921.1 MerR family transcriptional regulator [Loigolactobacillus backii]ANK69405.1 MerR family transcriptional regulator [Loigolactobacillus backii]MDA5387743.1 MerR family transcriptional regulator [Loigolactobacillus backii]
MADNSATQEQHYRIGDFAQLSGLSSPTLRFYEKEGLIQPQRTTNGLRYYTKLDLSWIKFLRHLLGTGMTIGELKQYVAWRKAGDQTIPQRLELLQNVQQRFLKRYAEIQHNLQILDDKVNWYEHKLAGSINEQESFANYLETLGHAE